jgi:hypothetical protein
MSYYAQGLFDKLHTGSGRLVCNVSTTSCLADPKVARMNTPMFKTMRSRLRRTQQTLRSFSNEENSRNISWAIEGHTQVENQHPSLVFCTVHKCASVYVGQLLANMAISQSIVPIDLDRFVASSMALSDLPTFRAANDFRQKLLVSEFGKEHELRDFAKTFYRPTGCFYGPFRNGRFVNTLPESATPKILVMLRDPRDAQTSLYYSRAYSHAAPEAENQKIEFVEKRNKALSETVDEFVLGTIPRILRAYQFYVDHLLGQENVAFVKYEEMVTHFPSWLDRVIDFWGLEMNKKTRDHFLQSADFTVQKEDVRSHKRQVTPGDHLRKLQPETIEVLNEKYRDVLAALGYDLQGKLLPAA